MDSDIFEWENRIICGNSLEILKKIPSEVVDAVITSPPYNYGVEYDSYDDSKNLDEYLRLIKGVFDECVRLLKPSGRFIINIKPIYTIKFPTHYHLWEYFKEKGMIWRNEIIWDTNNYSRRITSWGSWKSPSDPYIRTTWEYILVYSKGSSSKKGDKDLIDITADEFKKFTMGKWNVPPERNMKKYGHPAMFPVEIVYRLIKLFTYKNDLILDPFNGVGTTTYACKLTNRRYIGIDISQKYCEVANDRLNEILI